MTRRNRIVLGIVCLGLAAGLGYAIRAAASGIPSPNALSYAGILEDGAGPISGPHNIQVILYDAAGNNLCQSPPAVQQNVTNGRFSVSLPDTCTAAVGSNANVWVSVLVDGSDTGRTKIGAVPYAVEANHTPNADTAATANAAGGTLATTISTIQGQVHTASAFRAHLTGAPSIPNGGSHQVFFDTREYDLANEYNSGAGTFTPTQDGYYLLACTLEFSFAARSDNAIQLEVNGSTVMLNSDFGISGTEWAGSTLQSIGIVHLSHGQPVTCSVSQSSGSPQSLYSGAGIANTFSAARLF